MAKFIIAVFGDQFDLLEFRDRLIKMGIRESKVPDNKFFSSIAYWQDDKDFTCYSLDNNEFGRRDLSFTLPQDLDKAVEAIKERVKD